MELIFLMLNNYWPLKWNTEIRVVSVTVSVQDDDQIGYTVHKYNYFMVKIFLIR